MEKTVKKSKTMKKLVTTIPATKVINKDLNLYGFSRKRRVCGYARVSSDEEEQLSSYEAQVDYYEKYIKKNDNWEYVNLYSDEGITGCNTKKRAGFNKMISDALNGKIDLIVTKSISRFARNTVDSLSTIRKLKEHNVEVYFERENIWTMDSKGELLITILSSLAQEEARSISENSKWGQRKRFSDGKYSVAYTHFLGYDKGFKINEKEAKVVKYIFDLFVERKTYGEIKHILENDGILSPSGKKTWYIDVIKRILMNEKYCGDALLQKGYTSDFLTKTRKINKGEVKQFYITDGHEAIISREQFELVQLEIKKKNEQRIMSKDIFSGKLYCKVCGDKYYRCCSYSKDKNKNITKTYITYKCDSNGNGCESKYIEADIIKKKFLEEVKKLDIKIFNNLISEYVSSVKNNEIIDELKIVNAKIKKIQNSLNSEFKDTLIKRLIDEKERLQNEIKRIEIRNKKISSIKDNDVKVFDDDLFVSIVDKVYIDAERNVDIIFYDPKN